MASFNVDFSLYVDGTEDGASPITVAFDDATNIPRHVTLENVQSGAKVGLRLDGNSTEVRLTVDSDVEMNPNPA